MDRLATLGGAGLSGVDGAASRLGEDGAEEDEYHDGDTDTDLSDLESVASFASEADGLGSDAGAEGGAKKKKKKAKRSWFTITLGPADELEEDEDKEDDGGGFVASDEDNGGLGGDDARLESGPGFDWRGALFGAGLGEPVVEALEESGVESLREVGFLGDADLAALGVSAADVEALRKVVAEAAARDAAKRPLTDWRLFLVSADLKEYVPALEARGVASYHELSLIGDVEYGRLTKTGMTPEEIGRLRAALSSADAVVGAPGAGRGAPPLPLPAQKKPVDVGEELLGEVSAGFNYFGGMMTSALGLPEGALHPAKAFEDLGLAKPSGSGSSRGGGGGAGGGGGGAAGADDVAARLRKLEPLKAAALLDDVSLATQVKLLAGLPPAKAAAIVSAMHLEPSARGALLLKLPNRVRGLVIVELKPSTLAQTMTALEPPDVNKLLCSLDSGDGDRFKAFSLFHDNFAAQLLAQLSVAERSLLVAGMRIKEQALVLGLMGGVDRGQSLKALPMEVQVSLLGIMSEETRRDALAYVEPAVLAMMLVDMEGRSREAALGHMSPAETSALLVAGMTALSKIEIEAVETMTRDELTSRLNRLEDLAAETTAAITKRSKEEEFEDGDDDMDGDEASAATGAGGGEDDGHSLQKQAKGPSKRERMRQELFKALRSDARKSSAAARDLCLTLQNKHLGAAQGAHDAPPPDVVEQLVLAGRRAAAVRILLSELAFMEPGADAIPLVPGGVSGAYAPSVSEGGPGGSGGGGVSIKKASQEDLLLELGSRLGARGDDPSLCIEKLALAAGFTKRGHAIDVYSGATASRLSTSSRDVKFSLRCEGLSVVGFDGARQAALEALLVKGYGLKKLDGDAKLSVVGFGTGGSYAGSGPGGEGACAVVELLVRGFKTSKAAIKFSTTARAAAVPVGSERSFGVVTFENPPTVCGGDGGGGGGGSSSAVAVPGAPAIVAASAGDGEAKVLVVPPSLASGAYDPSVVEVEVISNPGRLRGVAPVGEPVIVRGLANGTSYRFTAHVRNATGWSALSAPSLPLTPGDLTAPPLPPEIAAVTSADCDVELAVLVAPAGRHFLRSATLVEVKSEPDGRSAFAPPGVPVLLQGLRPGVQYRFRARAKNVNGWSRSSKPTAPITLTAPPLADLTAFTAASLGTSGGTGTGGGGGGQGPSPPTQAQASVLSDHAPEGYEDDDEAGGFVGRRGTLSAEDGRDLDGAAKQALLDHNLEKDLLRKGKSPLEALILKQRYKKQAAEETDAVGVDDEDAAAASAAAAGDPDELTPEETVQLERQLALEGRKQRFSVVEEVNMGHDVLSKQMKDIEGLAPADNKFLRRFVGLMATKGMPLYRHGSRWRSETVLMLDAKGTTVFWASKKNKTASETSVEFKDVKEVVKGQVYSWYRSIKMDPDCCVSLVCHPTPGKKAARRVDLECASTDDATLLFAALSVLSHARKPDALASKMAEEENEDF